VVRSSRRRALTIRHSRDADWTAGPLSDKPPDDAGLASAWQAAWNGHLENRVLTDEAWTLLRPHHRRAIETLIPVPTGEWEIARAGDLAHHLGNRYWWVNSA
jgi:hypothetical protein